MRALDAIGQTYPLIPELLITEAGCDGKIQQALYYGTKEELQTYTRNLILNYGKLGLMLGGDCTVDAKIGWERLRWVAEAARSL